jgi:subtilisin family serine protease
VKAVPEGRLGSADAVASQRQKIADRRSAVFAELAGTRHRTIRAFETIPFVALEVWPDAWPALQRSGNVVAVEEDRLERAALSQSVPLVGANQAWAAGFDGTGIVVAILDTGVDKTHPFLSGKVVEEACYSNSGNCPNGLDSQTGSGAGVPCTYASDGCRHGTRLAGIAAGAGPTFSGVAKGAQIMAVQVFSRFTGSTCADFDVDEDPCALTFLSDQIAGLERVFALRNQYTFAAVNLSIGSGKFTSPCDSEEPARKAVIDNLRSVGIATVIASGNDGFADAINAPACISTAVSVGSTTKADIVSSFSNSASFLSLLAPGQSITSSVPGGAFATGNGTSFAAPHVAGAWAILKQKKPTATVTEVLNALTSTGLPITDPKNGIATPRIRVNQALQTFLSTSSPANVPQILNVVTLQGVGGSEQRTFLTADFITFEATYVDPNPACAGVPPVLGQLLLFNPEGQLLFTFGAGSAAFSEGSKSRLLFSDVLPGTLPAGDYQYVFLVRDCTNVNIFVSGFQSIRVLPL